MAFFTTFHVLSNKCYAIKMNRRLLITSACFARESRELLP